MKNSRDRPSTSHGNDIVIAILVVGLAAGANGFDLVYFFLLFTSIISEQNDL
jgi:hypothetical protein